MGEAPDGRRRPMSACAEPLQCCACSANARKVRPATRKEGSVKPRALPSIVEGEVSDYHWTAVEDTPTPEKTHTVQPTEPTEPKLPTMKIVSGSISAEELVKNLNSYVEAVMSLPNWQEVLAEKSKAAKEARKLARREARRKAAA
jgi:hypothetical protein